MLTCLGAAASDRHTHTHTHTRPLACSLWRAHVIRVLVVVYVPTCDFHLGATIITVWCRVSTGVRPSRESALPAAAPSQSWVTPTLQTPTGARQPQRPPPIRRTINICPASLGEHCRPAAIHCLGRCSSCTSAAGRYLPQTRSHVMSTSRTCERTQPHTAASQSPRPWFSAGGRAAARTGRPLVLLYRVYRRRHTRHRLDVQLGAAIQRHLHTARGGGSGARQQCSGHISSGPMWGEHEQHEEQTEYTCT